MSTPVENMNEILAFHGKKLSDLTFTPVAITASGTQHLHLAAACPRGARLLAIFYTGTAATTLTIQDTAQTPVALSGLISVAATGGATAWTPWGLAVTGAGAGISLVAGSGGNIGGIAISLIL